MKFDNKQLLIYLHYLVVKLLVNISMPSKCPLFLNIEIFIILYKFDKIKKITFSLTTYT